MSTETLAREPLARRAVRRIVRAADAISAPHGIDRYIEQVIPTWSSTEVRGTIVGVDRTPTGSVILTVTANSGWLGFRPGQYTQLSVEIDGVRHTRCYSMASAAPTVGHRGDARTFGPRTFELGIKAHPQGLVSQHLVAHAAPGMVVGLTPAAGDFFLPTERPDRTLLISGGSGITPVMSMLRTLVAEGHTGPIAFLHYATTPEAVLFADELAAIARANANVTVLTAFDQAPDAGDLTGLLDADHLAAADARWAEAETFVCGPAPLMDSVRAHLDAAGAGDRFHQEAFTAPVFATPAARADGSGETGGAVAFTTSSVTVDSDGGTLLTQAEAAGLTPASGCRMGICHTCTRVLSCGTVRDAVTGELTTVNGADVEIRVCVSVPVGDVAVDL